MIRPLLALLLPALAAWLWLDALRIVQGRGARPLAAAIAVCTGLGLSSLVTMACIAVAGQIPAWFVPADVILWTLLGVAAWWRRSRREAGARTTAAREPGEPRPLTRDDRLARGAFVVMVALAAASVAADYLAAPHGQWDAWVMWNHKARFMTRGGTGWAAFVGVPWMNPSHPILISTSVARLWTYAGHESTIVPALLHAVVGAVAVALVVGALDPRRARAWIAGAALVAPWTFVDGVSAQMADLPLGLFVAAALILATRHRVDGVTRTPAAPASIVLAGLLAGFAAWTKNEGLLVLAVLTLATCWRAVRARRPVMLAWWIIGTLPSLVAIVWLKSALAPTAPEYFGAEPTVAMLLARVTSASRHAAIVTTAGTHLLRWGGRAATGALPLAMVVAAAAAVRNDGAARPIVVVLAVMLAAYTMVWLLSPVETTWLVATTVDRLTLQIWPALLIAAFSIGLGRPDRDTTGR